MAADPGHEVRVLPSSHQGRAVEDAASPTLRPSLCPVPFSVATICGHWGDRAAQWLMDWVLELDSLVIKALLDNCVTKQVLKLA